MTATWDVVGLGENSVDHVYVLPGAPATRTKAQAISHRVRFGGQVATTLCACAAFGLRASYIGAFGDDADGVHLRAALGSRGLDLRQARTRPVANRSALVLVDGSTGDRSVYWMRDAALTMRPGELDARHIARCRLLHVDATDEDAALSAAGIARAAGIPVTCDIDTVTPGAVRLLAAVSVPILAETVAEALTGEPDLDRALRALRRMHAGPICVTLGSAGSVMLDGDAVHRAPAFQVEAVDTTGAGDVFRGAFIHGLLRGDAPPDILRVANAAAALSCLHEGAIDGVPTRDAVEAFLAERDRSTERTRPGCG